MPPPSDRTHPRRKRSEWEENEPLPPPRRFLILLKAVHPNAENLFLDDGGYVLDTNRLQEHWSSTYHYKSSINSPWVSSALSFTNANYSSIPEKPYPDASSPFAAQARYLKNFSASRRLD